MKSWKINQKQDNLIEEQDKLIDIVALDDGGVGAYQASDSTENYSHSPYSLVPVSMSKSNIVLSLCKSILGCK